MYYALSKYYDNISLKEVKAAAKAAYEEYDSYFAKLREYGENIITRAIGATGNVNIDFFEVPLRDGDIILMCSDGLSNMIEDKDILEIVTSEESLESKAAGLIATANENGGSDNISVVLIAYEQ